MDINMNSANFYKVGNWIYLATDNTEDNGIKVF